MQKLNDVETARIKILHQTGAVSCRDLAKIFKVKEARISQITRGYKGGKKSRQLSWSHT